MRVLHFAFAATVGFLLYQFAVVDVGGVMSAIAIPVEYFRFFGSKHEGVGHAVLGILLHVLPTVLLVAGGVLVSEKLWPQRSSLNWLPYFLGMLGCAIMWESLSQSGCLPSPHEQGSCGVAALQQLLGLPWWAIPVVLSPWLGLALASWQLRRTRPPRSSSVA